MAIFPFPKKFGIFILFTLFLPKNKEPVVIITVKYPTGTHTSNYLPRLQTRVRIRLSSVSMCQMMNGYKLSSKSCDWTRVSAFLNTIIYLFYVLFYVFYVFYLCILFIYYFYLFIYYLLFILLFILLSLAKWFWQSSTRGRLAKFGYM